LCGSSHAGILGRELAGLEEMAMIFGLSLSGFTTLHVILSLIGIAAGLVVAFGMLGAGRLPGWTALFLATTILTSVTGFMFPFTQLLPSHVFGIISLIALALAVLAYYVFRLEGRWRWLYILSAVLALYLNVFVGVVQAFQKVSFLQPLSPTQSEPPFIIAQLAVLVLCLALGAVAIRSFHPAQPAASP
jgi:hypothetical protein